MKSITIHGIDDEMDRQIKEKAAAEGKSLKGLLEQALRGRRSRREEFADLFGRWSAEELTEFERATKDLSQFDPRDWK